MRRGEIWWADFGEPLGSEPGFRRPALIVQADTFNQSRINTIVLVPLSRTLDLAAAPGNVLCCPRDSGLKHPSVVNVSQVSVVDKRRLIEKVGSLPGRLMTQVDEGVRLVLGL
jgi:mRNA interferase MazF